MEQYKINFIKFLIKSDALKFGEFTLKSGRVAPYFLNIGSFCTGEQMHNLAKFYAQALLNANIKADVIFGPAYKGIPLATSTASVLSSEYNKNISYCFNRKEAKTYGQKDTLIGSPLNEEANVVLIDDVITAGTAIRETIEILKENGNPKITGVLISLNRMEKNNDGENALEKIEQELGAKVYPIVDLDEVIEVLYNKEIDGRVYIDDEKMRIITEYRDRYGIKPTYEQRAEKCVNPTAKKLLKLMAEKQTNLCIAADVTTKRELLRIADELGPEICVLKTHIDIIKDFDPSLTSKLKKLSERHNFLIFEDRKFADIGNTVKLQYEEGIYQISDWADIVNAHTVPGPGIIDGLKEVGMPKQRGLLLLAEMSSQGTLAKEGYTEETLKMAKENKDFVIGFITMKKLIDDPCFINFSPGVKLEQGTDNLGQQYNTPEKVIKEQESDIIIVGRGIYMAENPVEEARKYRQAGWKTYLDRV